MENQLKGAAIIGQSGGPTSVINASAYGVIRTALDDPNITKVYGAAHGICGVLDDVLYDMGQEDAKELELLLHTPSSALGSVRYKLKDSDVDDTDYKRILEIFKKYDVRYFFYNGGNDSMDTCNKISKYMQKVGYACRIMGVPKTIDNDLWGTDHCPGYGSAAKFVATSCMEIYHDARVYDTGMICIIEIMGRHAGWLTAASSLATAMAKRGYKVGIMDADITGPSIPTAFGLDTRAVGDGESIFPELTPGGIKIISLNLLLENKGDPVVWRGSLLGGVVKQFWTDVRWGELDYLFIDMPPGTGDVPLTVFQSIPVDGIVVVTSPQDLVSLIVTKAVRMAEMMNKPILGVVENYSYFQCPNCGEKHYIFGKSNLEQVAAELQVKVLAQIPMDPAMAAAMDQGAMETREHNYLEPVADAILAHEQG